MDKFKITKYRFKQIEYCSEGYQLKLFNAVQSLQKARAEMISASVYTSHLNDALKLGLTPVLTGSNEDKVYNWFKGEANKVKTEKEGSIFIID